MHETREFLTALWGVKRDDLAVALWFQHNKTAMAYASLDQAAHQAVDNAQRTDVYLHVGLAREPWPRPTKTRLTADSVVAIPGLWADLDINGGPDDKTGAAPDRDAALELAAGLAPPTLTVNSGHGIQAWWLLAEPWLFFDADERQQAARVARGYQAGLQALARAAGFRIDATHDLARLMRLPGTLNHKGQPPAPVTLLAADGPRYDRETLEELARPHMTHTGTREGGVSVRLSTEPGEAPARKLVELKSIDPDFLALWYHHRELPSLSEYDMAIANALVKARFTDQEIADSLRLHRREHGDTSGKGDRADYLALTISKARAGVRRETRELEREQAVNEMIRYAEAHDDGEPREEPRKVTATFSKAVGGPKIKELVQEGRDPSSARFVLVLEDGREVALGAMRELARQQTFRENFAVVTQFYPVEVTRKKWDEVVRGLLTAAEVHEVQEVSYSEMIRGHLEKYLERRMSADRDGACRASDPFRDDEYVYVHAGSFLTWLRQIARERIDKADLLIGFKQLGMERKSMNYTKADGRNAQRSYYRIAPDSLEERNNVVPLPVAREGDAG